MTETVWNSDTRIGPDGTDFAAATAAAAAADEGGVSDFALAKSPTLYITDPKDDAVEFKINDAPFARFSAGQELEMIKFSFEAVEYLHKGWTSSVYPPQRLDPSRGTR